MNFLEYLLAYFSTQLFAYDEFIFYSSYLKKKTKESYKILLRINKNLLRNSRDWSI